MTFDINRRRGLELATKFGASKTLEAIKNKDFCYKSILETALDEGGADKLVSVLKESEPFWAQNALKHLDLSDEHRNALLDVATVNIGERGGLDLHLIAGAAYFGWMTMFWRNPGGIYTLPNAANSDRSAWKWSIKLRASTMSEWNQWGADCSYFAINNAPIQEGATCWMVVNIETVDALWELTQYTFTYKAGAERLKVNSWGAILSPNFCGIGIDPGCVAS
jgi:hypothetical protein